MNFNVYGYKSKYTKAMIAKVCGSDRKIVQFDKEKMLVPLIFCYHSDLFSCIFKAFRLRHCLLGRLVMQLVTVKYCHLMSFLSQNRLLDIVNRRLTEESNG